MMPQADAPPSFRRPDTECGFELRDGLADAAGRVHRSGTMRAARAGDELRALCDFRVYLRPDSFPRVLLSRVITSLGSFRRVDPGLLERLSPGDLRLLEDAYRHLNDYGEASA